MRLILLVNGTEYDSAEVTSPLNSRYWFWKILKDVDPYSNPHNFARALRLKPNEKLPWMAKATGFFTTPLFKKRGISGWLDCPEEKEKQRVRSDKPCSRVPAIVCATGDVFRRPAVSNDGLATIDLTLEALEFCSETLACHQRADFHQAQGSTRRRYLRVEYRHRRNRIPKQAERVRICGKLLWDTDREGWWEIHPRNASDVEVMQKTN